MPRHLIAHRSSKCNQIHIFADASEKAYGAVAYVRSVSDDNTISVRLLCSKSRVAPPNQVTLPRLELCAAKLAAELMKRIQGLLKMQNDTVFLWSDSTAVLGWINSDSALYHTFVANRISVIQQLTNPQQWRHVRSEDNPADLISRGVTPEKLKNNNFWFYGPTFLHGSEQIWPARAQIDNCDLEKRQIRCAATAATPAETDILSNINHKNSFRRLQRILAYMRRFLKRPTEATITITAAEMEDSLMTIIKILQRTEFQGDIKQVARHGVADNKSPIKSLSPILDEFSILRVGGRLEESVLPYEAKHQALLPCRHPVTKLLVMDLHKENLHAGVQTLLSIVRQRFWPLKAKILARSVVQNCTFCTRAKPTLFKQLMGNLPLDRVQPARPFVNTGVDFFGPV